MPGFLASLFFGMAWKLVQQWRNLQEIAAAAFRRTSTREAEYYVKLYVAKWDAANKK